MLTNLYLRVRAMFLEEIGGIGTTAAVTAMVMLLLLLIVAMALSGPASEAVRQIDAVTGK